MWFFQNTTAHQSWRMCHGAKYKLRLVSLPGVDWRVTNVIGGNNVFQYNVVTWASWRLESPFVQELVQANNKVIVNATYYHPFVRKPTGVRWTPPTKDRQCGKSSSAVTSSGSLMKSIRYGQWNENTKQYHKMDYRPYSSISGNLP